MNVALRERAIGALADAPPAVQKAFIKRMNFLARSPQHPSLHAKKYNEAKDLWQARVNDDWRFIPPLKTTSTSSTTFIRHPK